MYNCRAVLYTHDNNSSAELSGLYRRFVLKSFDLHLSPVWLFLRAYNVRLKAVVYMEQFYCKHVCVRVKGAKADGTPQV